MRNATLQRTLPTFTPRKSAWLGLLLLSLMAPFYAVSSASAKDDDPVEACRKKYVGCIQRCSNRYPDDWLPCINRTCNKQHDNCVAAIKDDKDKSIRPTAGRQDVPKEPRIPAGAVPGRMPSGGLLDTGGPTFFPTKPASTGTMAPTTPPPAPQIR